MNGWYREREHVATLGWDRAPLVGESRQRRAGSPALAWFVVGAIVGAILDAVLR